MVSLFMPQDLVANMGSHSHRTAQPSRNGNYVKKLPDPQYLYIIDFFCGCGGTSWGFVNTRQSHLAFKVLAGIDIDPHALTTFERNVRALGIMQDVRKIASGKRKLEQLIPAFDPEQLRPLVFIGCAPCQGFSAHRKKDDRDDPRNNLILAFAQVCTRYHPDYIVMENVPEILTGRFRGYYESAARALRDAGYLLSEETVDVSLYGVPQRRKRAIVLGSKTNEVRLPAPILSRETALTVRHAISHLRPIRAGEVDPDDPWHRAPSHTERVLRRIRRTPKDGGDRRALPPDEQLRGHRKLDRSATPGFADVYGRLRWETPSVTITAKSSTPSCGRFLHPEQDRNISVREAAILQGFPQTFQFAGPFVHQYRQIGEAMPPLFSRFVAWAILDHIRPVPPGYAQIRNLIETPKAQRSGDASDGRVLLVDGFAGAGGLSLGFRAAGFEAAYAFDTDPDCVRTFNQNVAEVAHERDVRHPKLPAEIDGVLESRPYIVVGGPPCQGFSQQRRGAPSDPRNNLVLSYADLIRALRRKPLAVLLENVTYLDSPRGCWVFEEYCAKLTEMGYVLFRHELNSAECGLPQLRRRIFVVGLQPHLSPFYSGPQPFTHERWPTVGGTLWGLPDPDDESLLNELFPNHKSSREGSLNRIRIAFVDMGQGRMAIPYGLRLPCHRRYDGHLDVYGRLDWWSQARTITGGFDSFTRGEYAHPLFHRSITPREAARIQGFPDWFAFMGTRASVRRQIGNAVPPPMAFAAAHAILKAIRESEEARWENSSRPSLSTETHSAKPLSSLQS